MEEELPRRLDELEAVGVGNNKMKERKAREKGGRALSSRIENKTCYKTTSNNNNNCISYTSFLISFTRDLVQVTIICYLCMIRVGIILEEDARARTALL